MVSTHSKWSDTHTLDPKRHFAHLIHDVARQLKRHFETEAQRQTLRELGCDYGQGYLLGRPAPWARTLA